MSDARIIDGNAVAARLRKRVAAKVEQLADAHGMAPGLATILVGDDPASEVYVRMKRNDSAEVGIESFHHEPGAGVSEQALSDLILALNADARVHGILLQLPLPTHLDQAALVPLIDPGKDVDGLTPLNAGLLAQDQLGAMVPCTPAGVMELLREAEVDLDGARAVVIGRSILVGKPLAQLLLASNATVTQCHSHTRDLAAVCREADVIVAAAGRPELVTADMVSEGAVVIDVGTNRTDAGLVGDVDFEGVRAKARAITPVPGGVGPMTRAMLLVNTVAAAQVQMAGAARRACPPPFSLGVICAPNGSAQASCRRDIARRGGHGAHRVAVPVVVRGSGAGGESLTGWEALGVNDVILALIAACAISVTVATAFMRVAAVPIALDAIVTLARLCGPGARARPGTRPARRRHRP